MTIKIKKVSIEKDGVTEERIGRLGTVIRSYKKLEGAIVVELSEGTVTGRSEVNVESLSEELKDELYNVLNKIENELNGIENKQSGIKVEVGLDLTTKQAANELIESYLEYQSELLNQKESIAKNEIQIIL